MKDTMILKNGTIIELEAGTSLDFYTRKGRKESVHEGHYDLKKWNYY
nr:MAG TPA: hypothetical protein [Caudoviricetes sp.]